MNIHVSLIYAERKIMFYKVIKNKQVIDALDKLVYVRYQLKHKILLMCDEAQAEGILSSDRKVAWHIRTLKRFPTDDFDTVTIEEIDEYEYRRLKLLHVLTPEEIIDEYTKQLIERGIL